MTENEVLKIFSGCALLQESEKYFLLAKQVEIPWLLFVPKTSHVEDELFLVALEVKNKLQAYFPDSIYNLAKIGNKTPVFHIHLLFRNEHDILWPQPVWCDEARLCFDEKIVNKIKQALDND